MILAITAISLAGVYLIAVSIAAIINHYYTIRRYHILHIADTGITLEFDTLTELYEARFKYKGYFISRHATFDHGSWFYLERI